MKAFIQTRYQEMVVKNSVTAQLARSVQLHISKTLSGHKYINELTQNADDEGASEITFVMFEDYLLVSHNGNHFSEKDVEGICEIASEARKKTEDPEATGNMGLGFRACFSISDTVYIFSNEATFKFDKHHAVWSEEPKSYPWPVTPIWAELEELPLGLRDKIDATRVSFVLKLKSPEIIADSKAAFTQMMQQPQILLFMKTLGQISYYDDKEPAAIVMACKKHAAGNECTLTVTGAEPQVWLMHESEFELDEAYVAELPTTTIPKKYHSKKTVSVQLAAPDSAEKIDAGIESTALFTRLPTHIRLKTPFLFNSTFLLNAERTQWEDSPDAIDWNALLMDCVAEASFIWFETLAKSAQQSRQTLPLTLMAEPSSLIWPTGCEKLKARYEESFNNCVHSKKYVLTLSAKGVTTKDVKLDPYQIIGALAKADSKDLKCASYRYLRAQRDKFRKIGMNNFDIPIILGKLAAPATQAMFKARDQISQQFSLLQKLFNQAVGGTPAFLEGLKKIPLILTSNGEVVCFKDAVLPDANFPYSIAQIPIRAVHPDLMALIQSEKDLVLKSRLLKEGGMPTLTLLNLISQVNALHNKAATLQLCRSILSVVPAQIPDEDWKSLRLLHLVTSRGSFCSPNQCYLANAFSPVVSLSDLAPEFDGFIADEFATEGDLGHWRAFFIKIGVVEHPSVALFEEVIAALQNPAAHVEFLKRSAAYFKQRNQDLSLILKPDNTKGLLVKTVKGNFVLATQCYLADSYEPQQQIQQLSSAIEYVSDEYVGIVDRGSWKKIFVAIGVQQSLKISVFSNISVERASELAPEYMAHLRDPNTVHVNSGNCGAALFPSWSVSSRNISYHQISHLITIDFIAQIRGTPLFWQVLRDQWTVYERTNRSTSYIGVAYGAQFNRPILGSLHYEVQRKLQLQYPGVPLGRIYSSKIRKQFPTADLPMLTLEAKLTDAQMTFFGFESILTFVDISKLLQDLKSQPISKDRDKKLAVIYEHLLKRKAEKIPQEVLATLELPNEKQEFVPYRQLQGFAVNPSEFRRKSANPSLLWRPAGFQNDGIIDLCKLLSLPVILKKDIQILSHEAAKDESVAELIMQCMPYLIAAELSVKNPSEPRKFIQELKEKVLKLEYFPTAVLSIGVKDVFGQATRAWISANILYYLLEDSTYRQKEIAEQLYTYLELTFFSNDLQYLLSDPNVWLQENGENATRALSIVSEVLSESSEEEEAPEQTLAAPPAIAELGAPSVSKRARVDGSGAVAPASSSTPRAVPATMPASRGIQDTGRLGESKFFDFLKQKYAANEAGVANGTFTAILPSGGRVTVKWMNYDGEKGLQYDFLILKSDASGQEIKRRYIDVKASKNAEAYGFFSQGEWDFLQANQGNYRVYSIPEVHAEEIVPRKIKNLSSQVQEHPEAIEEIIDVKRRVRFGQLFAEPKKREAKEALSEEGRELKKTHVTPEGSK